MNKKLIISLATIAVVAVAGVGATVALFSDTETSAANIFTAGSIDLKVDHAAQSYNGVDCKTCSVTLVSDASDYVVETAQNAQLLTFVHPAWTADVDGSENDAKWIWATNPVTQSDVENGVTYTFSKDFVWMGPINQATLSLGVGADNTYEVWLNGTKIAFDSSENNFSNADVVPSANIAPEINQGQNTLEFKVTNLPRPGWNPQSNPAGLLYKLVIDGNCGDAYFQNYCSLWQATDLTDQKFFNFDDVKPGDFGTNVISLHVTSNDAYACLIVGNKDDQENPAQPLAPELAAGDVNGSGGNPLGNGELSNYLNVFTWADTNGNGVYDAGEVALGSGPLSTLTSIMSMDPSTSQFLAAGTTQNIGLAWCAGTLTANQGSAFTCDGNGMGNIAQSDSFTADLTAYATQERNNAEFRCSDVDLTPTPN